MWHTMELDSVRRKLNTNLKMGLTNEEVEKREKEYGKNQLKGKKKEPLWLKFLKQFNDFMIIILILASIVSAIVARIDGSNDYMDSIIIIGMLLWG